MKSLKSTIAVVTLSTALLSLSGCILFTGPIGWVGCAIAGCNWAEAILGAENQGRREALNPLPMNVDVATKLGVTVNDLAQYNDELVQVTSTNAFVENDIQRVQGGKVSAHDQEQMAMRYGFASAKEMDEVLKGDKMNEKALAGFAQSQNLTITTARLYLKLRFEVKEN